MQVLDYFVYVIVIFSGPSILKEYSLVSDEQCDDVFFVGLMGCFGFFTHFCAFENSPRCFVCRFAHERCKLLKHLRLFLNMALLLTIYVRVAIAPSGYDLLFWMLLLSIGQMVLNMVYCL